MAQFRGVIQGGRGSVSRLGHASTGLSGVVNGWNTGARIEARHLEGRDILSLWTTGGSNNSSGDYIGAVIGGKFYAAGADLPAPPPPPAPVKRKRPARRAELPAI